MTRRFRRPTLLRLEDRCIPANLTLSTAFLCDKTASYAAMPNPIIGQMIAVRATWTGSGLTASDQYIVRYSVDGVQLDSSTFTGTNSGDWVRWGWFASPGAHTVTVTVDGANTVSETNESDNSKTINFTPQAPTDLPQKFLTPIGLTANRDWAISNYADVNPLTGAEADYNGGNYEYDGHDAIDAGPWGFEWQDRGFPVLAAADGTVTQVFDGSFDRETSFNSNQGNYVLLTHGNGWQTLYYHFAADTITVKVGNAVKQGQVIGLMGSSGSSTGTHLHYTALYRGCEVEVGYSPSHYWLSPLPYGGDVPAATMDSGVTNYVPTADIGERVSPYVDFGTTQSGSVYAWVKVYGSTTTDTLTWRWIRPNGTVYTNDDLLPSADYKYSWWYWNRSISNFASAPGTWQVAMLVNGIEQRRSSFNIVAGPGSASVRVTTVANGLLPDGRTTPIDLGSVAAGGTGPTQLFTIRNHGVVALTPSNLVLPPGFTLSGGFPASISAGGSASFTVQVDSSKVGAQFGQLQFSTNDPDTPLYRFNLKATVTGSTTAGAPILTLPRPAAAYSNGSAPRIVNASATITDSDTTNFAGGSLIVELAGRGLATDQLAVRNQGTAAGKIGVEGANITFSGVIIGTMSGGNGTTPLAIALSGNVTTVVIQSLLRNITYANSVATPSVGRRYVRFTLLDETAKESNRATMQVAFTNQQGPVWVTGVQVNDGSAQRSRVTSLTVQFSRAIPVPGANAFSLTGPGSPGVNVVWNPAMTQATLTFTGPSLEANSLADGTYTLNITGSQLQDSSGNALDSDLDGMPAGAYAGYGFHRFFGDADGDRNISASDFIQFRLAFGGTSFAFDIDGDGGVSASDFIQFRLRFGGSI